MTNPSIFQVELDGRALPVTTNRVPWELNEWRAMLEPEVAALVERELHSMRDMGCAWDDVLVTVLANLAQNAYRKGRGKFAEHKEAFAAGRARGQREEEDKLGGRLWIIVDKNGDPPPHAAHRTRKQAIAAKRDFYESRLLGAPYQIRRYREVVTR